MHPEDAGPTPPAAAHRRLGAVAIYFGYRAVAALVLATPIALFFGGLVGEHPRGDAALFDPGGLMLAEAARLARAAALPLAAQAGLGALAAAALGLLPLSLLVAALGRAGPLSGPAVAGRAARALGPLALLWGVALLAQTSAAALALLLGGRLVGALAPAAPARDLADLGVAGAALLLVAAIGVVHDAARVAAVHEERGFYTAAARGLSVALAAPLSLAWSWAARALLALALLAAAAWAARRVGTATGARLALAFALHHAALAAAAFLRASWLAAVIRRLERDVVARRTPAPAAS